MRIAAKLAMFCSLGVLAGCGSKGGISSITNPPPVNAQTTYSNASLNGTYSVNLGDGIDDSIIGTFVADGNGNLTSGTLTDYNANLAATCPITFTGTYTINSNASGTATITIASPNSNCFDASLQTQLQFALEAGQQGETLHIAETTGSSGNSNYALRGLIGVASKQ